MEKKTCMNISSHSGVRGFCSILVQQLQNKSEELRQVASACTFLAPIGSWLNCTSSQWLFGPHMVCPHFSCRLCDAVTQSQSQSVARTELHWFAPGLANCIDSISHCNAIVAQQTFVMITGYFVSSFSKRLVRLIKKKKKHGAIFVFVQTTRLPIGYICDWLNVRGRKTT